MHPSLPLPHLTASNRGRNDEPAPCEEPQFCRTESTELLSGSRDREKLLRKLTKAHSGSSALSVAEDGAVGVYFEPRAFEELASAALPSRDTAGFRGEDVA